MLLHSICKKMQKTNEIEDRVLILKIKTILIFPKLESHIYTLYIYTDKYQN